ncbi:MULTISPECIES: DUF6440 family protein [unclassified Paenibacillus]|uniref:DUF6440 family protein n=1 Tax=unclassified Paenibacillus TaxID=185978 RepID=UPI00034E634F|nr:MULTISPECIES: DUF6440 family protein [unclassified Paenibacillus]EPD81342.1 hypothetical protein HMPREF1207_05100 [Paenibacillus sp. HGH0039]
MRKAIQFSAIVLTLSGCSAAAESKASQRIKIEDAGDRVVIITDTETGCQYFGYGKSSNGKALTPRLREDGRQVCNQ